MKLDGTPFTLLKFADRLKNHFSKDPADYDLYKSSTYTEKIDFVLNAVPLGAKIKVEEAVAVVSYLRPNSSLFREDRLLGHYKALTIGDLLKSCYGQYGRAIPEMSVYNFLNNLIAAGDIPRLPDIRKVAYIIANFNVAEEKIGFEVAHSIVGYLFVPVTSDDNCKVV